MLGGKGEVCKFNYNANILFLELDIRYSGVCYIRVPKIFFKKRCVKGKKNRKLILSMSLLLRGETGALPNYYNFIKN